MEALILVDIQNDFLPGGALAVPDGDAVVPVANRLIEGPGEPVFGLVVATQDWHPGDHGSFASMHPGHAVGDLVKLNGLDQILWPDHCVQGTAGAELADALPRDRIDGVFTKGTDTSCDSYSGFFDNGGRRANDLHEFLRTRGVDAVYVMGLATDYCVKFTTLDAGKLGYRVVLVTDGCRGVNVTPGDAERALDEMRAAGVEMATSDEVLATVG